jgi:hypothetical protein
VPDDDSDDTPGPSWIGPQSGKIAARDADDVPDFPLTVERLFALLAKRIG